MNDLGFLYDNDVEESGEIIGSPEEKMLLSPHDRVYIQLGKDKNKWPTNGTDYTVYTQTRPVKRANGKSVGTILQILGTVKVDSVDSDKGVAEGTITEAIDVIERGQKVGPVIRRMNVVPPTTNDVDLRGEILASIWANVMYGQGQLVVIDKGESSGLKVGNRLDIVRRGDPWQNNLGAVSTMSAQTVQFTTDGPADVHANKGTNSKDFPEEIVAEIRVVTLRKDSATCVVTQSRIELEAGDVWVARSGY
jgi:hypothetical protein